ncbi:hypothetical protein AAFG07_33190 [Bradyrhizobium sp. B097]|uniref:hypothetical protein n=1 Tax=Bradyrhizobium sp. B097 TaxID=3140244 RepID=UPI003183B874
MRVLKLLSAPVRSIANFPLFQLLIVIAIILWLQAADDTSLAGQLFSGLDRLVDLSVQLSSKLLTVKSFTRAWLTSGFMIAYVYLVCLLILVALRALITAAADIVGRWNVLWLRSAIARERGVRAYRAWLPLERIRPADVPQNIWEERFAWPASDKPPYPPLPQRIIQGIAVYLVVVVVVFVALEIFIPPVAAWLVLSFQ